MAKRKSINKRLSRYSRSTVGSAILDPDTGLLDNEQPYWWRNLENDTIARPSARFSTLNQTSQHLNSNSLLETSKPEGEWWKVLDTPSRRSKSLVTIPNRSSKDAIYGTAALSESDEESEIAKKEPPLRSEAKKVHGNTSNALKVSKSSVLSTSQHKVGRNSSVYDSKITDEVPVVSRQLAKNKSTSLNQSQETDEILKQKPSIFRQKGKNRDENIFEEILNERREAGSKKKNKLSIASASPIIARADPRTVSSLIENEPNTSDWSIPKITSTLLENTVSFQQSSAKDSTSDTETIILKRKSKLLMRRNIDTKRNVFKNILTEEESDADNEDENRSIRKSAARDARIPTNYASGQINKSHKSLESVVENIQDKSKHDERKRSKGTSSFDITDSIVPATQSAKKPIERVRVVESSVTSSETSNTDQDLREVSKVRSKLLRGMYRSQRKNMFEEILEADEHSHRTISSNRSKGQNFAVEDVLDTPMARHRSVSSREDSNIASEDINLKLSSCTDASDIEIIRASRDNSNKERTMDGRSVRSKIDHTGTREQKVTNATDDRSSNISSHRKSIFLGNDQEDDVLAEENIKVSRRGTHASLDVFEQEAIGAGQSRHSNRSQVAAAISCRSGYFEETGVENSQKGPSRGSVRSRESSTISEPSDVSIEPRQNISTKQSRNLDGNQSFLGSAREITSSEIENGSSTGKSLGESRNKEDSPKSEAILSLKDLPSGLLKSTGSSRLLEYLLSTSTNKEREEKPDEVENTRRERSKSNLRDIDDGSTSSTRNSETEEQGHVRSSPKSGSMDRSQMQLNTTIRNQGVSDNESESSDDESTWKNQTISSDQLGNQSISGIANKNKSREVEDTAPRGSKMFNRDQERSKLHSTNISEKSHNQTPSKRPSRSSSKLLKQVPSVAENKNEDEDDSDAGEKTGPRGSKMFNRDQERSKLHSTNISEKSYNETPSKRPSRSSSKLLKQVPSVAENKNEDEDDSDAGEKIIPRGRKMFLRDQERSNLHSTNIFEKSHNQTPSKKPTIISNKLLKKVSSVTATEDKDKSDAGENIAPRQSKRLREIQNLHITNVSGTDYGQIPSKRQTRSSTRLQKPAKNTTQKRSTMIDISERRSKPLAYSESETEDEVLPPLKEPAKNSSRFEKHSAPGIEEEEISNEAEDTTRGRSSRGSKKMVQQRSIVIRSESSDTEDVPVPLKDPGQGKISTAANEEEPAETENVVETPLKVPQKHLSESRKHLDFDRNEEEMQSEAEDSTRGRSSKGSTKRVVQQSFVNWRQSTDTEDVPVRSKELKKRRVLFSGEEDSEETKRTRRRRIETPRRSETVDTAKDASKKSRDANDSITKGQAETGTQEENRDSRGSQKQSIELGSKGYETIATTLRAKDRNALLERQSISPRAVQKSPSKSNHLPSSSSKTNDLKSPSIGVDDHSVGGASKKLDKLLKVSLVRLTIDHGTQRVETSPNISGRKSQRRISDDPKTDRIDDTAKTPTAKSSLGESRSKRLEKEVTDRSNIEIEFGETPKRAETRHYGGEKRFTIDSSVDGGAKGNGSTANVETGKKTRKRDSKRSGLLSPRNNNVPLSTLAATEKSPIASTRLPISQNQRTIKDFFRRAGTVPASQVLGDKQKMDEIRMKLDRIKKQETDRTEKEKSNDHEKKLPSRGGKTNMFGRGGKSAPKQSSATKAEVHKAFLVNGTRYKVPRLPRPKHWVTDRLYRYLWKSMEPKYNEKTRLVSEKFVRQLSNVTTVIMKSKAYLYYKAELHALMQEMARLGIIRTRRDFYNFCHEYLPYELQFKMVPILLPGNERNIPYEPDKVDEPILNS
ncbi:PREDICTED: uncharacterized protein LOC107193636 [Dufourea novaeangliae]|uniref:uncharacterized protein LOC107193636 n=1 Tax=Dufourea novaeangliae TaxID=178035 RepID=UPI000767CA21|nr:PREDICTED: uncharacterized protein LOC107193636 [Dufourea novaeangliae]